MPTIVYRLPKIEGTIEISAKVKGKPVNIGTRTSFQENIMDDLTPLFGDGKARVSVSCDMSAKDYGKGAAVSVSISCSVNQDSNTIQEALAKLAYKTRELAKEQLILAGTEYNNLMQNP